MGYNYVDNSYLDVKYTKYWTYETRGNTVEEGEIEFLLPYQVRSSEPVNKDYLFKVQTVITLPKNSTELEPTVSKLTNLIKKIDPSDRIALCNAINEEKANTFSLNLEQINKIINLCETKLNHFVKNKENI